MIKKTFTVWSIKNRYARSLVSVLLAIIASAVVVVICAVGFVYCALAGAAERIRYDFSDAFGNRAWKEEIITPLWRAITLRDAPTS